ncbi:MAG: hypothetical protein KC524_12470 [Gammaproteobacteria bacterium]|nr:hypothetical protein [Gammaproteobacteria bacterium]
MQADLPKQALNQDLKDGKIGAGLSRKACCINRKVSFTVLGRWLVFDKIKGWAFGAGFTFNVDDVEG